MKANELRIGNLLNSDKDTHSHTRKVSGIGHENHIVYLDSIHNRISSERIDIGHLKPIPLTEEWLLRFGFTMERIDKYLICYTEYPLNFQIYSEDGENYWIDKYIGGTTTFKHVHQLQNLYFALTGQELEVKL